MKKTKNLILCLICASIIAPQFAAAQTENSTGKEYSSCLTGIYQKRRSELFASRAWDALFGDLSALNSGITDFELARLNKKELRLLRNSVYAKYGHIFNSDELTAYFSNFAWYKPAKKVTDKDLTENELKLIERITAFENINENAAQIKLSDEKTGIWQVIPVAASGWAERFVFYYDGKMDYLFSQMAQLKMAYEYRGTCEIKGNALIFSVKEMIFAPPTTDIEKSGALGWEFLTVHPNKITFENPIVLKFPLSPIAEENIAAGAEKPYYRKTLKIGSVKYYKCDDNPTNRY